VSFKIQVAGASPSCAELSEVNEFCATRGGHGFALVVQRDGAGLGDGTGDATLVGTGGNQLGFGGLRNAVAVEFDTWFDAALVDPFDNHVAVQAERVRGAGLTADHRYHLALSPDLPDMGDGDVHSIRVVYRSALSDAALDPLRCGGASATCATEVLQSSEHFAHLVENGVFDSALGVLEVFVDDFATPRAMAPLALSSLLNLHAPLTGGAAPGFATLGITAATGARQWQTHRVWDWHMCSSNAGGGGGTCRWVFRV
jgi:hypothetical protein